MAVYFNGQKIGCAVAIQGGGGVELNLQDKSVTPTEQEQTVTYDEEHNGLGTVTVSPIPSTYVGSGVTRYDEITITPTESQQSINGNAYLNDDITINAIPNTYIGSSIPQNGDVSGSITTQGGSVTIPRGYTTGGTVSANIEASAITNSIINGASNVKSEGTSIDSFTVTVDVPSGYHTSQQLSKTFSNILPELESDATATMILNGYEAYNDQGGLIHGTMPNNGSVTQTLTKSKTSYTIPLGYHDGTGTVTRSVNLQTKSISPDESTHDITPDTDYDGLSKVSVGAISSTYVGSGINKYTDSGNAVLNGTTISKSYPAGYYSSSHGATHSTVNIPDPSITVSSSGLITASGSWTAGFTTDTSYSNTQQMTTKGATSITPNNSTQTAISSGTYATGNITVAPVPTETKTTNANGTVTPSSGKYLSSVTVNVPFQHYYTGNSVPSSTLGADGDIYLYE